MDALVALNSDRRFFLKRFYSIDPHRLYFHPPAPPLAYVLLEKKILEQLRSLQCLP